MWVRPFNSASSNRVSADTRPAARVTELHDPFGQRQREVVFETMIGELSRQDCAQAEKPFNHCLLNEISGQRLCGTSVVDRKVGPKRLTR